MNEIINGILESLENEYPDYNKYVEDVEQGFQAPCFVVNILEYNKDNLLENERAYREKETVNIQVLFFPKENQQKRDEKREIYEHMYNVSKCTAEIRVNNKPIRANSSKSIINDNVLQVLVSYDFNTINKITGNLMTKLIERSVDVGRETTSTKRTNVH